MTADDLQFRKRQGNFVDIRNWTPGLRWHAGTGMADLRAIGDAKLDAFFEKRPIARVIRRPIPYPRYYSQGFEAVVPDVIFQRSRGIGIVQAYRRDADQTLGKLRDHLGNLLVGDHASVLKVPGAQQRLCHAGLRHRRRDPVCRAGKSNAVARPGALHQRRKHGRSKGRAGSGLGPNVDCRDRHLRAPSSMAARSHIQRPVEINQTSLY